MAKQQQRVNWQQKQEQLVQEISEVQQMALLLPKDDIYKELEILKVRVQAAKLNTRQYRSYLRSERVTFSALRQELNGQLQRRRKRSILFFFLSTLPTTFIYVGMYFSLIPGKYYAANSFLYLVACGLILCAWVGWFFLSIRIYKFVLAYFVFPLTSKYPALTFPTEFAITSFFILMAMNPLFQAAHFAGETITPSWGIFAYNLWVVLLGVGSGNLFTALSNSIGICMFLCTLFLFLRQKKRKSVH